MDQLIANWTTYAVVQAQSEKAQDLWDSLSYNEKAQYSALKVEDYRKAVEEVTLLACTGSDESVLKASRRAEYLRALLSEEELSQV